MAYGSRSLWAPKLREQGIRFRLSIPAELLSVPQVLGSRANVKAKNVKTNVTICSRRGSSRQRSDRQKRRLPTATSNPIPAPPVPFGS